MGWMGKIIGGTLGFALGGPLGAIAGAAFGHAFDREGALRIEDSMHRLTGVESSQLTFFVAAFSMLAKLVSADGRVSKEEVEAVKRFMTVDLGLDGESSRIGINIFNTALNSPGAFEDFAAQFYTQFAGEPQMLELMIEILMRVAVADGELSGKEEEMILSAARIFRLSTGDYEKIKSRYVKSNEKYYAVLGCRPDDTDDHIRHQYRKMVRDYHPDKIASMGLPEEFTRFATEKFREIQEAWEVIKRERNIK